MVCWRSHETILRAPEPLCSVDLVHGSAHFQVGLDICAEGGKQLISGVPGVTHSVHVESKREHMTLAVLIACSGAITLHRQQAFSTGLDDNYLAWALA